jgi:NADPH-dependent 2,4-dienoyl-CoA reductase/sulfur reductase-like enzyme
MSADHPFRVVVAGGGVAGLEALLALHELAGEHVRLTLIEPSPEVVVHALEPAASFDAGAAGRLPIGEVAAAAGAHLVRSRLEHVDADAQIARTHDGRGLDYDALVVAVGARPVVAVRSALTWWPGGKEVWPGSRRFPVDRVVALPRAYGPEIGGLRADIEGFLVTDEHCRVRGARRVWAAGDATNRLPAQGGLAARQADCAAQEIASLAGSWLPTTPYVPLLRAQLRTGRGSLWLQRDISDPLDAGDASGMPLWSPPGKIAARRLGALRAAHDEPGGLRLARTT